MINDTTKEIESITEIEYYNKININRKVRRRTS